MLDQIDEDGFFVVWKKKMKIVIARTHKTHKNTKKMIVLLII